VITVVTKVIEEDRSVKNRTAWRRKTVTEVIGPVTKVTKPPKA